LLNLLIWFPVLALVLVSGLMCWRRVYRDLPFFFVYTVSALCIGIARYVGFGFGHNVYFYVYWVSELAGAVFVSLALYEVFLRRLFPAFQRVRFYRNLFPLAAAIVLLLTLVTASGASDKHAAFLTASRGADFIRTAILVFFVALMALMGREWPRYDFGIALGFGVQAATALADTAVRSRLHYRPPLLDTIEFIGYNLSCFIWLITFSKSQKLLSQTPTDKVDPETLRQAKKWEDSLKDFISPGKH
jgi:hypothetical protein